MRPEAPQELLEQADLWEELHRWERRELGRALRRLGLTYSEIPDLIPVPTGTLSNWCREIELTSQQVGADKARTPSQKGVPKTSQWRRRQEIAQIEARARGGAADLLGDPAWTAGVALYWAEGAKTDRRLAMANSDPRLLRLFMRWIVAYVCPTPMYSAALNLHADNDERAARQYWAQELGLNLADFTKTHIKADGTGHRKNHLSRGVCRVSLRRSTDAWLTTMVWIDVLAELSVDTFREETANLPPGR